MDIDQSLTATVMITVEEFLGQRWITLAALGRAALIGAQSITHLDDFQRSISNMSPSFYLSSNSNVIGGCEKVAFGERCIFDSRWLFVLRV